MNRFFLGLLLGAGSSGITWLITSDRLWTAVVGLVVLALVWLGEWILDDLL